MRKHHILNYILDRIRSEVKTIIALFLFVLQFIASNEVGRNLLIDLFHGNLEAFGLATIWITLTRLIVSIGISWALPNLFPPMVPKPVKPDPQEDLVNAP